MNINDATALKFGNADVTKAYLGTQQVWYKTVATPYNGFSDDANGLEYLEGIGGGLTLVNWFVANTSSQKSRGIRFYVRSGLSGIRGRLTKSKAGGYPTNPILATADFAVSAQGWNTALWNEGPVALEAGTSYGLLIYSPNGQYSYAGGKFNADVVSAPAAAKGVSLKFPASTADLKNGAYVYGEGFGYPNSDYNNTWYGIDGMFTT